MARGGHSKNFKWVLARDAGQRWRRCCWCSPLRISEDDLFRLWHIQLQVIRRCPGCDIVYLQRARANAGCVGATASPMVLCHLLNTLCLPILLYGLEAVPLSHANFTIIIIILIFQNKQLQPTIITIRYVSSANLTSEFPECIGLR